MTEPMSEERLAALLESQAARPFAEGCGDSSCVVKRPSGMATNGGCRCFDGRGSVRALREAASTVDALCAEVRRLRALVDDEEDEEDEEDDYAPDDYDEGEDLAGFGPDPWDMDPMGGGDCG